MANFVPIQDAIPYSDNLLNPFFNFDDNQIGWNVVGSGTASLIPDFRYSGKNSLRITNTDYQNTDLVIAPDSTDVFTNLTQDGNFFLSMYFYVESLYSAEQIPVTIRTYLNSVLDQTFECVLGTDTYGFVHDKWNKFTQLFPANDTEEFSFDITIGSDPSSSTSNVKVWVDAVKLEFDASGTGYPAQYSAAPFKATGWYRNTDTVYTSGSPFTVAPTTTSTLPNTNNAELGDLPTGISGFYNAVTNKFFLDTTDNMGLSLDDYCIISASFKAKSTTSNDVFKIGLEDGTGIKQQQTLTFGVASGTEQSFVVHFNCAVRSGFQTNGALPKITSTAGTLSIYDIVFETVLTHRR